MICDIEKTQKTGIFDGALRAETKENSKEKNKKGNYYQNSIIFAFTAVIVVCIFVQLAFDSDELAVEHARMEWNVFLSMTSYLIYMIFRYFHLKKNYLISAFAFLFWVLFFPNSFYMLTDLKYIANCNFALFSVPDISSPVYLRSWLYVFAVFIPVLTGVCFGFAALIDFRDVILRKWNLVLREIVIALILLPSGFAVTIGRFARVNSWDILNGKSLIKSILPYFSKEGLTYSLMYAFVFWVVYMLIYFFAFIFRGSDSYTNEA